MSSDFEAYEQDFGTVTAEITNKIGRIPKLSGGKKAVVVSWNRWAGASYQLAGKLTISGVAYLLGYFINIPYYILLNISH